MQPTVLSRGTIPSQWAIQTSTIDAHTARNAEPDAPNQHNWVDVGSAFTTGAVKTHCMFPRTLTKFIALEPHSNSVTDGQGDILPVQTRRDTRKVDSEPLRARALARMYEAGERMRWDLERWRRLNERETQHEGAGAASVLGFRKRRWILMSTDAKGTHRACLRAAASSELIAMRGRGWQGQIDAMIGVVRLSERERRSDESLEWTSKTGSGARRARTGSQKPKNDAGNSK
ncbi:hypothetical protein B0H13DRAFT_1887786 [Mycena leptocephala]|nr:hypothetical protein B0H13DRAFT_1887786 [Mycena leptocephala]